MNFNIVAFRPLRQVVATATIARDHPEADGDDADSNTNSGGGLIQGDEFLSLYIQSQQPYRRLKSTNENDTLPADSSAPIPTRHRSHDTAAVSVELSAVPADSDEDEVANDDDNDAILTRVSQNVVKLVTRGSRIVFIEDAPTDTPALTQSTSVSVTSSEHRGSSGSSHDNDAYTDMDAKDSMNEASSNFETILQPPPSTTPVETLNGDSRHRSVSYSSVSQSSARAPINGSNAATAAHISEPARVYGEPSKVYSEPARNYAEPERVYSEPARVYSEPARVYSEPARIYSEPAKVYSLPAQNYGEPAKVYGEPAKVYSLPAGSEDNGRPRSTSTNTPPNGTPSPAGTALIQNPASTSFHFGVHNVPPAKRIIFNLDKLPYDLLNAPVTDTDGTSNSAARSSGPKAGHQQRIHPLFAPQLDGQRFHQFTRKTYGQQFGALPSLPSSTNGQKASPADDDGARTDNAGDTMGPTKDSSMDAIAPMPEEESPDESPDTKVGFVVEGRNYRKYRVEEKTSDGFIVGEYGVVSNNDGSLRGVRYTADSTISPNLIYETLMKFLSL